MPASKPSKVAAGSNADAHGDDSTAIGSDSETDDDEATAVGYSSHANDDRSTAVGSEISFAFSSFSPASSACFCSSGMAH